ncbi:hypothetical protein TSUD_258160 [Trifolium subterraneum]|uniref:TF-B3 domain-containing protein n=1 Tax=Trifolium subterraneum TaxID=3900 RepID=A0A2Z6ND71_TRISU|nr:hypothetical protein TSUD_258160 [Trifolium subterraneum]
MKNSTIREDALEYLEEVEAELQHDRIKLYVFKKVLRDYKFEKIDIEGIKVRMKGLLKEHSNLISGFNAFLPKEHHISPNFEDEDALAFNNAVKDVFQDKRENYEMYLNIIFDLSYKGVDIKSIVARMKELLKDHIDLYFGFEVFLSPTEYSATTDNQSKGDDSKNKIMKREAENERSNKPSKKLKINNNNDNANDQLQEERPGLPLAFKENIEQMEGSDVMLVTQNELTKSDVTENNGRLSIPEKQVINENFLEPNTSHRVEFEILDKVSSDADETSSSGAGSKKKIMKREAKNERSNKPLKKHKINNNNNDNDQLREERPGLPLVFKEKIEQMEGSDVMLVMQKKLTKTDVTANNNRLSIPQNECITENFLESEEKSSLDYVRGKHDKCHTIVTLYDGMCFKKWRMVKSETYNITGFNAFLPKEHQISPNFEDEDALAFNNAVKDVFQDKGENYKKYLTIIFDLTYKGVDIKSIVARMKELLKDHIDLYFGFEIFLSPTGNQFKGDDSKNKIMKREAENERLNKQSRKLRINNNNNDNDQLQEERPELSLAFKEKIEQMKSSDVMLVIQKELTKNDVVENNSCLSIPKKQVINENFLEPNTSNRVEFEILDKVSSDGDETSSSGEGSKQKIMKREAKNERSNKPLKKRKINNNNNDNDQLQEERPGLPLVFKEKIEQMEGSDVMLVMQKELAKCDVTANNGRLSIPQNECITENFLVPEEKLSLDYVRGKHDKCHTMSVSVLDPSVTLYDGMCFKKWKMVKSEIYNITGKWNKLVVENQLEKRQKVQLWSFRSHQQLCFALVKL